MARFESASPYQNDILALPVTDMDATAQWYGTHFGMTEVARLTEPVPAVHMERDGVRMGFAINGGDATQDGAAILVSNIHALRAELEGRGVQTSNWRIDESGDGQQYQVFFVVAPDGLCYYLREQIAKTEEGAATV